ncbi:MAG: thioredoxin domain-containing protein, partial [Halobacteriales archaeon]
DDKVLAGWNGLAVSAFARAGRSLDEPRYVREAAETLDFVSDTLYLDDGLRRRYRDGDVGRRATLDDHAYLARAALDVYYASGELDALALALSLYRDAVERYWDDDAGAFYYSDSDDLVARPRGTGDAALPSPAGVAAEVALELASFTDEFDGVAGEALAGFDFDRALEHEYEALASDLLVRGPVEVVVPDAGEWWREAGGRYLPRAVVTSVPEDVDSAVETLDVDDVPPVWRGREPEDVYVCVDTTCSPPLESAERGLGYLDDLQA